MNSTNTQIGIVGFGRFGELMTRYLATDANVLVYNRSDKAAQIRAAGGVPADLETVCRQRYVILSVPISLMQENLKKIAPLLADDTVVADVCSVKTLPCQWMRELLPASVSILASHPMFGPDSAANSLQGKKIVLCKERIDAGRFDKIKRYLENKGLIVYKTTPEEHDRQIAVSLSLTHFIGRSLAEFGAEPLDIDTDGYLRLLHTLGVVVNDTWQLFVDMHRYNPFAKEMREAFMAAMRRVNGQLNGE